MSFFPIFVKLQDHRSWLSAAARSRPGKSLACYRPKRACGWWPRKSISRSPNGCAPGISTGPPSNLSRRLARRPLVIAATSIPVSTPRCFKKAEARGIFCNAVDDIANCHFYYGSIVQRGDLQIAISTNGKSPALAQRLRKELEQQYSSEYGAGLSPWARPARNCAIRRTQGKLRRE